MERYIEIIALANEIIINLATRLERNEIIIENQSNIITGLSDAVLLLVIVAFAIISFIIYLLKEC